MNQQVSSPVPPDIVAAADYERHAKTHLDPARWAYISGGAADGITRRWNREGFDRLKLRGRTLSDMSGAHTHVTLFGQTFAHPILIAPVAFQKLAHPEGEIATALAASATSTPMVVSSQASTAIEDIAHATPNSLWFQLYMQAERSDTQTLVWRAEEAGCRALVVTVDAPVNGARNAEQRAGFRLPPGIEAVNLRGMRQASPRAGPGESPVFKGLLEHAPSWKDIEWLRSETKLPLLLKGIIDPADAERAVAAGADGVVVSNHGGRTLDTLPASIEALPRVAAQVAERVPILLDGGIRRGTDILKALALGAKAVLIGEPIMHALAVAGPVGVAHLVTILRAELEAAMALTGRATLETVDRSVLWEEPRG